MSLCALISIAKRTVGTEVWHTIIALKHFSGALWRRGRFRVIGAHLRNFPTECLYHEMFLSNQQEIFFDLLIAQGSSTSDTFEINCREFAW